MLGSALLTTSLALGAADVAAEAGSASTPAPPDEGAARDPASEPASEARGEARPRRFMIGLEAVGMQVPVLDSAIVDLDPRFTGRTVAMGGLGAFGRWRVVPLVGVDLGVRSGSVRYRDDRRDPQSLISHDLLMAEAGVSLFVARGEVGHLGLEAGGGGMFNRVRYELSGDEERSSQTFGSGFVRAGVAAELLTRRVAFVFALRMVGVMTDRDRVTHRGRAFAGVSDANRRAPVAALQTFVIGSFGVAYRF